MVDGAQLPRQFGEFEILRAIGRGGMGVVYAARQKGLGRLVALKVLARGAASSAKSIARFHREAEAAASLHHPNIVPIYTSGETDGVHWYAMELVTGPSLDRILEVVADHEGLEDARAALAAAEPDLTTPDRTTRIADGGAPEEELPGESLAVLPAAADSDDRGSKGYGEPHVSREWFDSVARSMAEVADALQHAHEKGVIHRDIKPSNLLVDAKGHFRITDFGLARGLGGSSSLTGTRELLGSPVYMSPEQLSGGEIPIDHRTDIYSFGATLYELLTLRRLHPSGPMEELLHRVLLADPVWPRQVCPAVPVELETICRKTLEKRREDRYASAGELAEDLRRYLERRPIRARRAGPVGRAVKWSRRHPAVAGLLVLVLVVLLVAGALFERLLRVEREVQAAREQVMRFVDEFENRDREVYQRREEIAERCALSLGMDVADIGAGTGFFTRIFSRLVGPEGSVAAVDINPSFVRYVEETCTAAGIRNVRGVVCDDRSVGLPPDSIDLAFICDTYRYFSSPRETMLSVLTALRLGGEVVVIQVLDGGEPRDIASELTLIGFEPLGEERFLERGRFLRFRKPLSSGSNGSNGSKAEEGR